MKTTLRSLFFLSLTILISIQALALKFDKGEVTLDELVDYNFCQKQDYSGEFCQDALKRWVKTHPQDAFEAGKMTRKIMNAPVAIPFFAQAFENKTGDCSDPDVALAVAGAIDLPPSDTDLISAAIKIGFDICFDKMKNKILETATITSSAFKNTCARLVQKGALSGLKLKKCQEITK